jgi:SET domain-containing protein
VSRVKPGAAESRFEIRKSPIHGYGVFANEAIAAGSFLGDYEGPETEENGPYVLWVEYDDGELVGIDGDGTLRFLNHARPANAEFRGHALYALCDIEADAEITFDYGEEW